MEDSRSASPDPGKFAVLMKVSRRNEELRAELRRISGLLSELLAAQTRQGGSPEESTPQSVRAKSLSNVRTQLSQYETQLRALQKRQRLSSPSKVVGLEQAVQQLESATRDKEAAVKSLVRTQRTFGSRLLSRSVDFGVQSALDGMYAEIGLKKGHAERLEEELKKGEESHKAVAERTKQAEKRFNLLLEQGAMDPDYKGRPIFTPDDGCDVTEVREKVEELSKQRATSDLILRKKLQSAEAQADLIYRELQAAQESLREKDQRKRILELKLSELTHSYVMLRRKNANLRASLRKDNSDLSATLNPTTAFLTAASDDPLSQTMA